MQPGGQCIGILADIREIYHDMFEKEFAEYVGVKYCSLVNSGSSANLLAFMALTSPLLGERQIRPGDEIITVAAGFRQP